MSKEKEQPKMKLLEDRIEQIDNLISNSNKEPNKSDYINTISLIGERGFGKTTILNEIRNRYTSEKCKNNYFVSEIIDPINIAKVSRKENGEISYGLIELFLLEVYKVLKRKHNNLDYNCNLEKLQKMMNEIIQIKNKTLKDPSDQYATGLSILEKISDASNMKNKIEKFIGKFMNELNYEKIIIFIDDFDLLETTVINQIIDELHYFIGIENIYFVFAYRSEQLHNSLLNQKLKENDDLIKNKVVNLDEFENQISQKLVKLFPIDTRITLPTINEFYEELEVNGKKRSEYVYELIEKTYDINLNPTVLYEDKRIILPSSPREYTEFKTYIENDKKTISGDMNQQINKLKNLQNYLFTRISEENIEREFKALAVNYKNAKMDNKNWLIVDTIRKFVKNNDFKQTNNNICFNDFSRDTVNTSIGDVLKTIRDFNDLYSTQSSVKFFYMLKIIISVDLKISLLKIEDLIKREKADKAKLEYKEYKSIIGGYYVDPEKNLFGLEKARNYLEKTVIDNMQDYKKSEVVCALMTLVSDFSVITKYTENSSYFDEMATNLLYMSDRGKGRLDNSRILYDFPALSFNDAVELYSHESTVGESIYMKLMSKGFRDSYRGKNIRLMYNPLNIFTSYYFLNELFIAYSESSNKEGYDKLLIWNLFTMEKINEVKTSRSSDNAPVIRVIGRAINEVLLPEEDDVKTEKIISSIFPGLDVSDDKGKKSILIDINRANAEMLTEDEYERLEVYIRHFYIPETDKVAAPTMRKKIVSEVQKMYNDKSYTISNFESIYPKTQFYSSLKRNEKAVDNVIRICYEKIINDKVPYDQL